MTLINLITPKDTEEIKPGIFLQLKKDKYRVVYPLAWNGKYRVKEQLKTLFSLRTIVWLAIILFLVWSYTHDVGSYKIFYEEVMGNPIEFCEDVLSGQRGQTFEGLEVNGIDTSSISSNS